MKPCKHGRHDGAMHTPCYQCQSEHLEKKIFILESALSGLVELKNHKDKHGKDSKYKVKQPIVWDNARMALINCKFGL